MTPQKIFESGYPRSARLFAHEMSFFDEEETYDNSDTPDLLHFLSKSLGDTAPYLITEGMHSALTELDVQDEKYFSSLDSDLFTGSPPLLHNTSTKGPGLNDNVFPTPSPTPTAPNSPTTRNEIPEETLEDVSGLPAITNRRGGTRSRPKIAPRPENISADIDTQNVLPEGVRRQPKRSTRQDAYSTQLVLAEQGFTDAFHDSFAAFPANSLYRYNASFSPSILALTTSTDFSVTRPTRTHRDNMPPEPKGFKELAKHPYCEFFKTAMRIEIDGLKRKNTWTEASFDDATKANKMPVPTMWVYKYKFDEQGWLLKFKAHFVARGDLQHTDIRYFCGHTCCSSFSLLDGSYCSL